MVLFSNSKNKQDKNDQSSKIKNRFISDVENIERQFWNDKDTYGMKRRELKRYKAGIIKEYDEIINNFKNNKITNLPYNKIKTSERLALLLGKFTGESMMVADAIFTSLEREMACRIIPPYDLEVYAIILKTISLQLNE